MKMSSVPYQKKKLEMMGTKEVITRLNRMTVIKLRYAVVAHNQSEQSGFPNKNQFDAEEEELRKDAAALNTAARLLAVREE